MTGEKIKRITIAADFPKYPVGRFPQNGAYNGTTFRDEVLAIALRDLSIDVVEVVFDGVAGFGSSFSEEAFGGLIRETAYAHGSGCESLPPDVEVEVRAGERVECCLYVPADGATT